jgi:type I site-specific restriction endonuclease
MADDIQIKLGLDASQLFNGLDVALKKVNEGGVGTVVCNATLLATGYDQPDLDCIIVLRNVSIRDLYCQMIGRVLRLSPNKKTGTIIDILGQLNTYNIFASIADLEKARNIVFDYSEFSTSERDLLEADSERNNLIEENLALKIIKQNEQAQYKNLVSYTQFCKLFKHEHISGKTIINEQQIKRINASGVSVIGVNNFENASKIIELLNKRSNEKLATPKQVRLLSRYVSQPLLLTFDKSTEIISSMQK